MTPPSSGTTVEPPWPGRIATAFGVAALFVIAVALAGLPLDAVSLSSFGFAQPLRPWTGLGLIGLSVALLGLVRGAPPFLSLSGLAVAAIVSLLALFQYSTDISLGTDTLLFPREVRLREQFMPGRPSISAAALIGIMTVAMFAAGRPGRRWGRVTVIFASTGLALGLTSILALVFRPPLDDFVARVFVQSLPCSLAIILLGAGILICRSESGWAALLSGAQTLPRRLRVIAPIILLVPTLASLTGLWLSEGTVDSDITQIIVMGVNVAVIAVLVGLAVGQVTRSQEVVDELTEALDTAAIVITELEGRIIHWSRGCQELLGWSADEIMALQGNGLESGPLGREAHDDLRRTPAGAYVEIERHISRKDGSRAEIVARGRRIDRADHAPIIVYALTDITDRTRMTAELDSARRMAAEAVAAHHLGVFEWTLVSNAVIWSPGSEERLGLPPGTLPPVGGVSPMLNEAEGERIIGIAAEAVSRKAERFGFVFNLELPDATTRIIECSASCEYDTGGGIARVIGVAMDVTEREARAVALQESRDQLSTIIETVPDALIVIDQRNMIRLVNQGAEQMFGYAAADMLGRNLVMLMPQAMAGATDSHLSRYLQTGERRVIGQTRKLAAKRSDGSEFPMEIRVGEAVVGGERLFTGFIRDISEKLAGEERLDTLRGELAHLSRINEMGDMAASMAHELNQPLAATVNFLGAATRLLEQGRDGQDVRDFLEMARQQSLRTGEIIRRLREFVTRREIEIRAEPIAETVRDAVALMAVGMGQEIGVTTSFGNGARLMFADRIQVQQVLVNLIRNAFEAVRALPRERREVLITTRLVEGDMVEISVSDTGPGIGAQLLEHLGGAISSTKAGGMGIGLSICRRIVEAHGGTLRAENRPTGGARFRFTLPLYNEKEVEAL